MISATIRPKAARTASLLRHSAADAPSGARTRNAGSNLAQGAKCTDATVVTAATACGADLDAASGDLMHAAVAAIVPSAVTLRRILPIRPPLTEGGLTWEAAAGVAPVRTWHASTDDNIPAHRQRILSAVTRGARAQKTLDLSAITNSLAASTT